MFLSNSLYIRKSYTIFFYEKVVKWCSYQKLHKNPCEYKAPINSQPIRTGKFINFLIYMIVYSAWKRYNVRENTNMHILFGNYSEKIVYVCCRSLRGSVDWNPLLEEWLFPAKVAPSAGAWIEIRSELRCCSLPASLPPRERGLKLSLPLGKNESRECRSLRGSVDWNFDGDPVNITTDQSLPPRERGLKSVLVAE